MAPIGCTVGPPISGQLTIEGVTSPLHQSRLHWIHDPNPTQSHHVEPKRTVPRNNITVKNSDPIPRNPLDPIPSASWYNSSYKAPSASSPSNSVHSNSRQVPRNNKENYSGNEVSAIATRPSLPAPLSSIPTKKRRSRRRRLDRRAAEREEKKNLSAVPLTQDARWDNQRAGPISEQQFQQFQQERSSHFQRPATPHQRGGWQCTRLPGM